MAEGETNGSSSVSDKYECGITDKTDGQTVTAQCRPPTCTVHIRDTSKALLYGVNDVPPLHITIVCGLQVWLIGRWVNPFPHTNPF